MLASLIIVFREMIEAGLIVGIVLAAARGVRGRWRMVAGGIAAGVLGACLLAAFAGQLAALFEGAGQELFQACVLFAAVAMLTWHNVWMASHGREMARELRAVGRDVSAGARPPIALAVVVGIAVLREGSEVVLFLYGVLANGGTTAGSVAIGGAMGVLAGAGVTALMYLGLLAIPAGKLFSTTAWLITLLAAGMAAQGAAFLQQGGFIDVWQRPLWDTSWLLSEGSIGGRLAHTLVGYAAQPDGLQLLAWLATVGGIWVLGRAVRRPVPPRPAHA
jgi:high-affinity iron transporter